MTTKKKYIIQQTVEINVQYLYETESEDPTFDFRDNGGYETSPILWIEPLSWDVPWDAVEAEDGGKYTPLTAEQVKEALGHLTSDFLTNKTVK